jgi:hypothetical protein
MTQNKFKGSDGVRSFNSPIKMSSNGLVRTKTGSILPEVEMATHSHSQPPSNSFGRVELLTNQSRMCGLPSSCNLTGRSSNLRMVVVSEKIKRSIKLAQVY